MNIITILGLLITAIATVFLAIFTHKYVKLTHSMLEETKAARGPSIFVDIELSSHLVKLIVGNIGAGPAYDIKIKVTDNLPWIKSNYFSGLTEIKVVQNGLSYLAPGRTLKFEAGSVDWEEAEQKNNRVEFKVSYKTATNRVETHEFYIELGQYSGVLLESFENPASEIANAIREIHRSISMATPFRLNREFTKSCPYCYEQISSSAKKCPKCYEWVEETPPHANNNTPS